MPNTKSAERRMRNSARKQSHNRGIKSKLGSLEKRYVTLLETGKKEEATTALRELSSSLDKAAKTGVIHRSAASRKKSRLSLQMNRATK